jgi:hypothetical protein
MTADPVKLNLKMKFHADRALRLDNKLKLALVRIKNVEDKIKVQGKQMNSLDSAIKSYECSATTAVGLSREFQAATVRLSGERNLIESTRNEMKEFCLEAANSSRMCTNLAGRAVEHQEDMRRAVGVPLFLKILGALALVNGITFYLFSNHIHLDNGIPKASPGISPTFLIVNTWHLIIFAFVVSLVVSGIMLFREILKRKNKRIVKIDKEA